MLCPFCGAPRHEIRVLFTEHTDNHTRRRRHCGLCEQRFSTMEVVVPDKQRVAADEIVKTLTLQSAI